MVFCSCDELFVSSFAEKVKKKTILKKKKIILVFLLEPEYFLGITKLLTWPQGLLSQIACRKLLSSAFQLSVSEQEWFPSYQER